jgi:hypothetical protein
MPSARAIVRSPITWIVTAVVVVILGVGLALTQPWKLFIDEKVDEAFPVAVVAGDTPAAADPDSLAQDEMVDDDNAQTAPSTAAPQPEVVTLAMGEFISRDHGTSGQAIVVDLGNDQRYVRIENLDTDNGPDLFVYLSTASPDAPKGDFEADFVNLGGLKGNIGNQNYEIPADVDVSRFASVVIWCDRFSVPFGAAPLDPA